MLGPTMPSEASTGIETFSLSTTSSEIAFMFQMHQTVTVTQVGIHFTSAAGATWRISIQGGTKSTGEPDGTIRESGNCYVDASPGAGWTWHTLGASTTLTRGEYYAVRVEHQSGTISGDTIASGFDWFSLDHPKALTSTDSGSNWTGDGDILPAFGLSDGTDRYFWPIDTISSLYDLNPAAVDDALLQTFTLPAGWGSTYQIAGLLMGLGGRPPPNSTDFKFVLFDDADNIIQGPTTVPTAYPGFSNYAAGWNRYIFDDTTLDTLNFGDTYRIGPMSAGTDRTRFMFPIGFAAAADANAWTQELSAASCQIKHWDDSASSMTDEFTDRIHNIALIIQNWTG